MSLRLQPPPSARPNRCQLFGPGSRPELFAKMAASAADVVNLDLEDSVVPNDKEAARGAVVRAVGDLDWGRKTLSVRINGLDTPWWHRDVIALLEGAGDRLDMIMIPKVGCAADLYAVDALVTAAEAAAGRTRRLAFEAIIETAAGLNNIREIAAGSPRLTALSFGAADYAASMGMRTTGIGGTQRDYYMLEDPRDEESDRAVSFPDPWHQPTVSMVAACREFGLLPVDGPFGDFSDEEGFRAQAQRSAALGCVGKWAIHPKQVPLANDVFTPSERQVREAREILAAMEAAERSGQGAAVYRGRLVDLASIRQAKVIVATAEALGN